MSSACFVGSKLEVRRPDGYSLLITAFCRVIRLILPAFSKATVTVAQNSFGASRAAASAKVGSMFLPSSLIRTCHS